MAKATRRKKTTTRTAKKSATGGKRAGKPAAARGKAPSSGKVRSILERELSKLRKGLGLIGDDESTDEVSNVGDIADAATHFETRELLRGRQNAEEELLRLVEAALKRLDEGTYGKCAHCGGAIESARLEALPHATTCISCKRREERGELGDGKK